MSPRFPEPFTQRASSLLAATAEVQVPRTYPVPGAGTTANPPFCFVFCLGSAPAENTTPEAAGRHNFGFSRIALMLDPGSKLPIPSSLSVLCSHSNGTATEAQLLLSL